MEIYCCYLLVSARGDEEVSFALDARSHASPDSVLAPPIVEVVRYVGISVTDPEKIPMNS